MPARLQTKLRTPHLAHLHPCTYHELRLHAVRRLAATGSCAISVSAPSPSAASKRSHLPEVPASNDRFAAVRAPEDLVVQTFRAVVVSKIKSGVPVLVLDHKLNSHIAGPGAHSFQLERSVVAREHATVIVAGVVDEAAGFLRSKGEASAKHSICDCGRHI